MSTIPAHSPSPTPSDFNPEAFEEYLQKLKRTDPEKMGMAADFMRQHALGGSSFAAATTAASISGGAPGTYTSAAPPAPHTVQPRNSYGEGWFRDSQGHYNVSQSGGRAPLRLSQAQMDQAFTYIDGRIPESQKALHSTLRTHGFWADETGKVRPPAGEVPMAYRSDPYAARTYGYASRVHGGYDPSHFGTVAIGAGAGAAAGLGLPGKAADAAVVAGGAAYAGLSIGTSLTGGLAVMAEAASVFSPEGVKLRLKRIAGLGARAVKAKNMINMVSNPGIQIESLILMFMVWVGENYESRLREKMAEIAFAERREAQREQRREIVKLGSGLLGESGSALALSGVDAFNSFEARVDGQQKSTSMMQQELQMLMHQWRTFTELMSNVLRTMHDISMTPARNIR